MGRSEKKKEKKISVRNFCLVKRIVDCDDGLALVGTLIQTIVNPVDDEFFQYRFNDLTAVVGGDMIQERTPSNDKIQKRTPEIHESKTSNDKSQGKAEKTMIYQMKAPLVLDIVDDLFPFRIVQASLTMELSKRKLTESDLMLRPNIQVAESKENKTDNVSLQRPEVKEGEEGNEDKIIAALKNKLEASKKFDLITPFPRVEYICEEKGNEKYCAKLRMTFFMAEEGISQVIEVIAPMLLIATLNTLHVLNNDVAANDYIANSATLALTAVFLLPSIKDVSNKTRWVTANNLYIVLVFIGLAFSSFPEDMIGTKAVAITGMVFFWVSFLVPFVNTLKYLGYSGGKHGGKIDDFLQKKPKNGSVVPVTSLVGHDDEGKRKRGNYRMKSGQNLSIVYDGS